MLKLCTNTPTNTFQSVLHPSLLKLIQLIIALLDSTFKMIYIYLTSHRLDFKDQLSLKEPKSGTPSPLIFETNHLIRSNVILKSSY